MKNGARRTPLALAFGDHPGNFHGLRFPADRAFFRAAVVPFLENAVLKEGRNAIIIHEFNTGLELGHLDRHNPEHAEAVENAMAGIERGINEHFSETLDAGRRLVRYSDWFDWGYVDDVARMNGSAPGRVRSIVEPLRASTAWLVHDSIAPRRRIRAAEGFDGMVEEECEAIRFSIAICLERSRRVSALVKEIRAADPDIAIVVPRGWAHRGMETDFDFSEFQIVASAALKGVPHFSSEAVVESFSRELGQDELHRYARLTLYGEMYHSHNRERLGAILEMGPEAAQKAMWEFNAGARRYALAMEDARMSAERLSEGFARMQGKTA